MLLRSRAHAVRFGLGQNSWGLWPLGALASVQGRSVQGRSVSRAAWLSDAAARLTGEPGLGLEV